MTKKSKILVLWTSLIVLLTLPNIVFGQLSCGEKISPLGNFELISQYSLGLAVVLMILGILIDHKIWKKVFLILALIPFAGWSYVNFFIDYTKLKTDIFNHNAVAEATLANIAEAQDRYKSEQNTYIEDLRKIYSHIGGAGGMNECVKILNVQAGLDHWRAEAGHVSSPDTVIWDSRAGTSLKKG
jgi:Tfp pilus assembly protein PilE